ncbi:MAG: hypothetical protein JSW73_03185 [Candidatus Woesearchaeota archaeon]|nr:MAG: hypothetical protein JSW73_03185 [Candidatus Woesearchaeota archaeon]
MVNLKFWKKEKERGGYEDFEGFGGVKGGFGPAGETGAPIGGEPFPQGTAGMGLPGAPVTPSISGGSEMDIVKKDIEVLNSKMDSLKASLEAINQKLINIESKLKGTDEGSTEPSWHY